MSGFEYLCGPPRHLALWTYGAAALSWGVREIIPRGRAGDHKWVQIITGERMSKGIVWATSALTALLLSFDSSLSAREGAFADEILFLIVLPLLTLTVLNRSSFDPSYSISIGESFISGLIPFVTLVSFYVSKKPWLQKNEKRRKTSTYFMRIGCLYMILFYIYV